jgi:hypothetical protein
VSVCFALFINNIDRDSLLMSACVFALKFMCSSKKMPSSFYGPETRVSMRIVDSFYFENKVRVKWGVRYVRIQP